jgi:hypothetical protein
MTKLPLANLKIIENYGEKTKKPLNASIKIFNINDA